LEVNACAKCFMDDDYLMMVGPGLVEGER
jgi:hypothetical protein